MAGARQNAPRDTGVHDPSSVFSMRAEWNFRFQRGKSSSFLYRHPHHQKLTEDPQRLITPPHPPRPPPAPAPLQLQLQLQAPAPSLVLDHSLVNSALGAYAVTVSWATCIDDGLRSGAEDSSALCQVCLSDGAHYWQWQLQLHSCLRVQHIQQGTD